jgi:cytochrome c
MEFRCPACNEPVAPEAYRCKTCRAICSYRNFLLSSRVICTVLFLVAAVLTWQVIIPWVRGFARTYASYKDGAIIPDVVTRAYLHLRDKNWETPRNHVKGKLLHLHNRSLANEHAILFVHGWNGDYLSTWGEVGQMIQDQRLNRIYDFVFYGYDTGLKKHVPLRDVANGLRDEINLLAERYKTVSIVTHSKGGLVTLRAILDRHLQAQPFPLHKVVMFAPPSENLFLENLEWIKQLPQKELNEMRAGEKAVVAELDLIHRDIDAIMAQADGSEEKERFRKEFLNKLSIIHGAKDRVVDFKVDAKTPYLPLLDDPTGASHYTLLSEFDHTDIVKIGSQGNVDLIHQFIEVMFSRLGRPPDRGHVDREQLAQTAREWVSNKLYEMNRMVLDVPKLGLVWNDVEAAVKARFPDANAEDARDDFIKQVYYIYIFLDMYAKMKELQGPDALKFDESPLKDWRQDWIPQLVQSETGRWMLQKELYKYYDPAIRAEIEEATRFSTEELIKFVNHAAEQFQTHSVPEVFKEFKTKGTVWKYGETYLFVIGADGKVLLHSAEPNKERQDMAELRDADGRAFLKHAIDGMSETVPNNWAFYRYNKPGEKQAHWKASYLTRITALDKQSYVVGSGVYNLNPDAKLIQEMVDRAAGMIEKQGESAIELIKDPKGPFVYADTFVLVADKLGKCIASADQTFHEGENLILIKDADGRSIGQRLVDAPKQSPSGAGWDECLWNKPRSSQSAIKTIYVRRAVSGEKEYIVASWTWK